MKTEKGFAPLILIIIGALVIGGYIYYDVNRDKTIYEPVVSESNFTAEEEFEVPASQNQTDQVRENTQDRNTEAVVLKRDDTTSVQQNAITSNADTGQEAVSSDKIKITQPKGNKTYQQGSSIDVRWETSDMSGKEMLLSFVNMNNSIVCDGQQIVDPYLQNGIPISTPNVFGKSLHIGGPSSPGGACKLNPGQYKIRLCEADLSDTSLILKDTCAFSSSFTVAGVNL